MPADATDIIYDSILSNQLALEADLSSLSKTILKTRQSQQIRNSKLISIWESHVQQISLQNHLNDPPQHPSPLTTNRCILNSARQPQTSTNYSTNYSYRELKTQNQELSGFLLNLYQIFVTREETYLGETITFNLENDPLYTKADQQITQMDCSLQNQNLLLTRYQKQDNLLKGSIRVLENDICLETIGSTENENFL
jgi:hypothetical protein